MMQPYMKYYNNNIMNGPPSLQIGGKMSVQLLQHVRSLPKQKAYLLPTVIKLYMYFVQLAV